MANILDKQTLSTLDILAQIVRDEVGRIISAGLVPENDLRGFIKASMIDRLKETCENKDAGILTKALANLHSDLQSISLPGDFTELTKDPFQELMIMIIPEEKEEQGDNSEPEDEKEDEECVDVNNACMLAIEKLKDIAYKCGSNGKHKAAHMIEKTINNIEANIDGD